MFLHLGDIHAFETVDGSEIHLCEPWLCRATGMASQNWAAILTAVCEKIAWNPADLDRSLALLAAVNVLMIQVGADRFAANTKRP
jgi:hypothetical protein